VVEDKLSTREIRGDAAADATGRDSTACPPE